MLGEFTGVVVLAMTTKRVRGWGQADTTLGEPSCGDLYRYLYFRTASPCRQRNQIYLSQGLLETRPKRWWSVDGWAGRR